MSALHAAVPAGQEVWRIGFWPAPWAWPEWRYAGGHRWDDAHGVFRTVYAGDTRYACFVEVLAFARPALAVESDYLDIEEDLEDARKYPSPAPGSIPADWLANRPITSAQLTGRYCDVTRSETIAALRLLVRADGLGSRCIA